MQIVNRKLSGDMSSPGSLGTVQHLGVVSDKSSGLSRLSEEVLDQFQVSNKKAMASQPR